MTDDDVDRYREFTWRMGRKVGRTIYAVIGPRMENDTDVLIGVMDSPVLAAEAVDAHNLALQARTDPRTD